MQLSKGLLERMLEAYMSDFVGEDLYPESLLKVLPHTLRGNLWPPKKEP